MAKVRLTEAQFKTYCRKLLNEKRSEDYAKNVLKEDFNAPKPLGNGNVKPAYDVNFQPLKQPLMAFKLVQERYLNIFINNGFSNKFLGKNRNLYGDGFYFVTNKNTLKRLPIEHYGNIMLTVEILPGARVFHYSYLGENDAIVVSPEDDSKIKIIKAEDINTGKKLYGKENNSNIYGDNWTSTIAEQKLEKMIAESVKKVLKEYGGISLSDYDKPDARYNRFDGDEMTQLFQHDAQRDEDDMRFSPEYDEKELVLNNLLRMRNKGLITDDELDKMRDVVGV